MHSWSLSANAMRAPELASSVYSRRDTVDLPTPAGPHIHSTGTRAAAVTPVMISGASTRRQCVSPDHESNADHRLLLGQELRYRFQPGGAERRLRFGNRMIDNEPTGAHT